MAETTIPVIKQGDALALPVPMRLNEQPVTAADLELLHCVEFYIGDVRKLWPDEVTFADGKFLVPLTQQETFAMEEDSTVELDVRVHFIGGDVKGTEKKKKIRVVDARSETVL